jgi:hypothetical protein
MEIPMNDILIGSKVVVFNKGRTYDTYKKMADLLKVKNWAEAELPKNGGLYIVKNTRKEINYTGYLTTFVYIEDINDKKGFVIDDGGLKVFVDFLTEEDFEV